MSIKLYFDEDSMDRRLVAGLRARGADVETAIDAGMIARSDEKHLAYAAAQGRVLYSFNVGDYYHLHAEYLRAGKTHAGIVLARQQEYSVGDQLHRLLRFIADRSAETMCNQVEFLSAFG